MRSFGGLYRSSRSDMAVFVKVLSYARRLAQYDAPISRTFRQI
jgi:hypothetical protein